MLNKLLEIARREIGYHEAAGNDNKYGKEYGLNGQPWCVIFLWWCFKHSGAGELFPKTAHCDGVRSFAKDTGRWINPEELIKEGVKPGDIVIWDYDGDGSGDHAGLAESAAQGGFISIEGNCADSVCRVQRSLAGVSGVYRPGYKSLTDCAKPYSADGETLSYGSSGYRVRIIQAVLMLNGFNLGPCGIDGEFGEMTAKAVKDFQNRAGLACDAVVGRETLQAMWKERD